MNFSIWFLSNVDNLLYLAMKNVYPVLIIGFVSCITTMVNRKLYTAAFCELLHLIPTLLLPPYQDFQLSLSSFYEPLLNPREVIAALQLVLKSPMAFCILDLLYYIPAEKAVIDKTIAAAILEFVAKVTDTMNKHL